MSLALNFASPPRSTRPSPKPSRPAAAAEAARPVFWGGYTAYFADPDGFAWELAHNPFFPRIPADAAVWPNVQP